MRGNRHPQDNSCVPDREQANCEHQKTLLELSSEKGN